MGVDTGWWVRNCWAAVGGEMTGEDGLQVNDPGAWLGGHLPVDGLAVGAVAAALLAAAELSQARGVGRPAVGLSAEHAALSFTSERHVLVGGAPTGPVFAALSRVVRCADGWARTHGNYPHHAAAVGRARGIDVTQEPAALVAALQAAAAKRGAIEIEDAVVAAGGCAAALRSAADWSEHPAGRAASAAPLIAWREDLSTEAQRPPEAPSDRARPAAGFRVLDLTRVIAGPVAGRTLAALGADVLRLDPPDLPELAAQHLDTGPGKRAAVLDLGDAEQREPLLAGADVVLLGYRPGALERFGLQAAELAERHPELIQVSLSAWGTTGPWAHRRGFDSLVQVASGIADTCATADGDPGVLPAQALDHATRLPDGRRGSSRPRPAHTRPAQSTRGALTRRHRARAVERSAPQPIDRLAHRASPSTPLPHELRRRRPHLTARDTGRKAAAMDARATAPRLRQADMELTRAVQIAVRPPSAAIVAPVM